MKQTFDSSCDQEIPPKTESLYTLVILSLTFRAERCAFERLDYQTSMWMSFAALVSPLRNLTLKLPLLEVDCPRRVLPLVESCAI